MARILDNDKGQTAVLEIVFDVKPFSWRPWAVAGKQWR